MKITDKNHSYYKVSSRPETKYGLSSIHVDFSRLQHLDNGVPMLLKVLENLNSS
jgi:hypothetical protein